MLFRESPTDGCGKGRLFIPYIPIREMAMRQFIILVRRLHGSMPLVAEGLARSRARDKGR
jgi:hypothetical protein